MNVLLKKPLKKAFKSRLREILWVIIKRIKDPNESY